MSSLTSSVAAAARQRDGQTQGDRCVIVMEGSVAGLTAGLLAMRGGHDVTVLDRGRGLTPAGPAEAWNRWPRLPQPHACLSGLRDRLRQHFPQVYTSLLQAGAVELPPPGGDIAVGCRRTTIELALRRHDLAAGIHVQHATTVAGLETRPGQAATVHALVGRSPRAIRAEVVIDAAGRNTVVPPWLPGAVVGQKVGGELGRCDGGILRCT